ncbi:hypothetical protein LEP1GSC056_1054 [Leptospira borgpetersenii str. Brem 328]|uniref:Uncharacterized protein n=2 Tax=Leptospira borgpetersenii str. Brem 328 TaxID=1049780 RepID=A0ABC9SLT3_LEPBO|nr:hypothetical protein LEP1GSC056_1054 [Leptospira borgpetersenii str. Brem 328]
MEMEFLAITLTGANVHDKHGVKDTLNSILIFSGKKEKTKTPLFR